MKNKIEILNKILPDGITQYGAQIDRKVQLCMDEFAEHTAIGFTEWVSIESYSLFSSSPQPTLWCKWLYKEKYTTKDLYQLYLEHIKSLQP